MSAAPRIAPRLVLRPFAKINLALRVGDRRPDGFHGVETLMQSVALSDRLTLVTKPGPLRLSISGADVPADATNLVVRAAEALWSAIGRRGEPHGAELRLAKRIPVAAGLGGGSADAAGALVGLNRLWRGRLTDADLVRVASTIGADVPFFLQGGTALGVGRGDEIYPVDDVRPHVVVLVVPAPGVATADAYRWLDDDRAEGAAPALRDPAAVDVGWRLGPIAIANDLEAPVVRRRPVVGAVVEACLSAGATTASMSGSGSAVFGLFSRRPSARVLQRLGQLGGAVLVTRTCTRREAARRLRGL